MSSIGKQTPGHWVARPDHPRSTPDFTFAEQCVSRYTDDEDEGQTFVWIPLGLTAFCIFALLLFAVIAIVGETLSR